MKWHSTAVEEVFLNCCTRSAKLIVERSYVKGCPPHFTFEPVFFLSSVWHCSGARSITRFTSEERRGEPKEKKEKSRPCVEQRHTHTAANNRKVIFAECSPRCSEPSFVKDVQNGPGGKLLLFRVCRHIHRTAKCRFSAYGQVAPFFSHCEDADNPRRGAEDQPLQEWRRNFQLCSMLFVRQQHRPQTQMTVFAFVLYP